MTHANPPRTFAVHAAAVAAVLVPLLTSSGAQEPWKERISTETRRRCKRPPRRVCPRRCPLSTTT